jgi:hypothetical protein
LSGHRETPATNQGTFGPGSLRAALGNLLTIVTTLCCALAQGRGIVDDAELAYYAARRAPPPEERALDLVLGQYIRHLGTPARVARWLDRMRREIRFYPARVEQFYLADPRQLDLLLDKCESWAAQLRKLVHRPAFRRIGLLPGGKEPRASDRRRQIRRDRGYVGQAGPPPRLPRKAFGPAANGAETRLNAADSVQRSSQKPSENSPPRGICKPENSGNAFVRPRRGRRQRGRDPP